MTIQLTGRDATESWCMYTLHSLEGKLIFVWYAKLGQVLTLRDALSNPAFDRNQPVILTIHAYYADQRTAQNSIGPYMKIHGMPDLNKTIRWNRRTKVQCHQTGQVFRNQLDCANAMGINQSQLSKHLRRMSGYGQIKGLTFSNIADEHAVKPVQYVGDNPSLQPRHY